MNWFFTSNDTSARLLRTIVQGVLGVICSYLSILALNAPEFIALFIVPLVMAILSPIMAEIGKGTEPEEKIGGSE